MSAVRDAIQKKLSTMSEPQLQDVLAAIQGKQRPVGPGITSQEFTKRFGGLIPADELDRMEAAIERDCEAVEPALCSPRV